jgi:hypothetical protein
MRVDNSLQTDDECEAAATKDVDQGAWRMDSGYVSALYFETLDAGKLVTVNIESRSTNIDMLVLERVYNYTTATSTMRLAYYDNIISKHLADMLKQLRKIAGYDIDPAAITNKIMHFYETMYSSVVVKVWVDDNTDGWVWGRTPSSKALGRADGLAWGRDGIVTTLYTGS